MIEQFCVVDLETYGIGPRPIEYPPEPVGVAIHWPTGKSEYLAFAHPAGDNTHSREDAIEAIRYAYQSHTVIFHNARFDMEVIWQHLKLPFPRRWHDTLLLAYLHSPDEHSFALKPLAQKFLKLPPDERDAVRDWLIANVKGVTRKNFGAFIAYAPVELVAPYAIGDVERTWRLFEFLSKPVFSQMSVPYVREKRLMPHLLSAERRGVRVDRPLLELWQDELAYALDRCDKLIRAGLNAPELNLDSDDELAFALEAQGLITHWETPDGELFGAVTAAENNPFGSTVAEAVPVEQTKSMSKDALSRCCIDKELVLQLAYRNACATMLRTFVTPWLIKSAADGRLHTEWHQTRGPEKNGTRTGRIASANPNLANVPNPSEITPPFGLRPLPSLRQALLPEVGCVWVSADYSQQELRITAHYENEAMALAYVKDPELDLHVFAQELVLTRTGRMISRKHVKNVAFASIYGAGIPKLARMMGVDVDEARAIRNAYFVALPGLGRMIARVKENTRVKGHVLSLGGRLLTVERPKKVKGFDRTFDYKQTNKLIQGSAADQTKQAIVDFCERGGSQYFLTQVYDEINISVPIDQVPQWAGLLKECMVNALPMNVPTAVDFEVGHNWNELHPLEVL